MADMRDAVAVDGAIGSLVASLGGVDALVNNAAIVLQKNILDTTEEDFMRVVSINQLGV